MTTHWRERVQPDERSGPLAAADLGVQSDWALALSDPPIPPGEPPEPGDPDDPPPVEEPPQPIPVPRNPPPPPLRVS